MINFSKSKKINHPYPILIIEDFFEEHCLKKIIEEFPSFNKFIKFKKTMVNRRFLSNENPDFFSYINKNKTWEEFYKIVNSKEFYSKILNLLVDDSSKEYSKFSNLIYNEQLNKKNKIMFNLNHYLKELTQITPRNSFFNFFREITKKITYNKKTKNSCFLRFDISSASNGYRRNPHKDSDGTIIAFLIYLEDKSKIGGIGGDFIINDNLFNKIEVLEPKKNKAVFFLSNNNSFHSVSEMKLANGWRKFIYGGFTSLDKLIWSRIK